MSSNNSCNNSCSGSSCSSTNSRRRHEALTSSQQTRSTIAGGVVRRKAATTSITITTPVTDGGYYMKGGHAAQRETLDSIGSSSCDPFHHYSSDFSASCGGGSTHSVAAAPKGLQNVGNTCYANATLQCLMHTALVNALTDPKASAIFRRYSSNPNILAQGSGSVDDSEDDCTTTMTGMDSNVTGASERIRTRERKRREEERLQENCQWLSTELRQMTEQYHAKTTNLQSQRHQPQFGSNYRSGSNSNLQTVPSSNASSWLYTTVQSCTPAVVPVINPGAITRRPDRLSKSLTPYQQEDAHEFLRALLGTLVMHGQNKELSSLFDGLLESSVTCTRCDRPSLTRDRYMDLSLDIADVNIQSLSDALRAYTGAETLSGDNAVYCRHCASKQTATKALRLATAPSILVCHLKRFAFDPYGRLVRLKKKIRFPVQLEISDVMSKVNQARPPPYELVAVLVHQGVSCDSGHYLAYVKGNDGSWYKTNDSIVEPVDLETVLSQQAYIVMYEVAEMRAKHGYVPKPKKPTGKPPRRSRMACSSASVCESTDDDYSSSSLLCGIDSQFADMCAWTRTVSGSSSSPKKSSSSPRHRKAPRSSSSPRKRTEQQRASRDDLSTHGESTVESADTTTHRRSRFRRSSSSGQLSQLSSTNSVNGGCSGVGTITGAAPSTPNLAFHHSVPTSATRASSTSHRRRNSDAALDLVISCSGENLLPEYHRPKNRKKVVANYKPPRPNKRRTTTAEELDGRTFEV